MSHAHSLIPSPKNPLTAASLPCLTPVHIHIQLKLLKRERVLYMYSLLCHTAPYLKLSLIYRSTAVHMLAFAVIHFLFLLSDM